MIDKKVGETLKGDGWVSAVPICNEAHNSVRLLRVFFKERIENIGLSGKGYGLDFFWDVST